MVVTPERCDVDIALSSAVSNGIESFWALLKGGHYGVFHYMSAKHLHRYVSNFSNRHKTADCSTIQFINLTVNGMGGRRLTYRELTNGNEENRQDHRTD